MLTRQDAICLQRAKDFIEAHGGDALSVETIAREAGISASGLQRLFRAAESRSVFDYVRNLRLERAFRRRFGLVPTAARGKA